MKINMEEIVSLAKRRGFIYQGSEIYGGLAGTFDYGPLGVALKNNIKNIWWEMFVDNQDDVYGLDASIIMSSKVWEASGHVKGFSDPLIECLKCNKRYRADHLEDNTKCPDCGGELGDIREFNMMFETKVGASDGDIAYLRPETAQGIFVNFKNVVDSFHPKLPFGIGQIGKAFRNEIAPRDFIFRVRELEQMEVEYFVSPENWEEYFGKWKETMWQYIERIGLSKDLVSELDVEEGDRAHYSKKTIDFEFEFPFGKKELYGLAYRTDYDLKSHNLSYVNSETGEKTFPHVIEPSLGVERSVLAVLVSAYKVDEMNGEKRVYLDFKSEVAPIKVAVFPLLKNKPELVKKAREIFGEVKKEIKDVMFDDNGNVGKRYRRQDEIGTPYCITVDFETIEKGGVTVRDRNTGNQERVEIENIITYLKDKFNK